MGVYSTLHITESKAKEKVIEYLEKCSMEELGNFMDVVLEKRLYNCTIVPDDTEGNDDSVLY
jgi:hypothetical protein